MLRLIIENPLTLVGFYWHNYISSHLKIKIRKEPFGKL